ncbi:hypothetical protein NL676_025943 [Syzygium grande]|nr:hypothetical protein NL676_025943 [Syzygium grande]
MSLPHATLPAMIQVAVGRLASLRRGPNVTISELDLAPTASSRVARPHSLSAGGLLAGGRFGLIGCRARRRRPCCLPSSSSSPTTPPPRARTSLLPPSRFGRDVAAAAAAESPALGFAPVSPPCPVRLPLRKVSSTMKERLEK